VPDILDKIFSDKKEELGKVKRKLSLSDVKNRSANKNYEIRDIRKSLQLAMRSSIIAEIKPRTPFKGILLKNVDPLAIAKMYADNGAADRHYLRGCL
jgi:indole-3-glycerol phosphate synthase